MEFFPGDIVALAARPNEYYFIDWRDEEYDLYWLVPVFRGSIQVSLAHGLLYTSSFTSPGFILVSKALRDPYRKRQSY